MILIDSPSDECIEPVIFGFTITGGNGTVVMVEVDDREGGRVEQEQIRGGGFLSHQRLLPVLGGGFHTLEDSLPGCGRAGLFRAKGNQGFDGLRPSGGESAGGCLGRKGFERAAPRYREEVGGSAPRKGPGMR